MSINKPIILFLAVLLSASALADDVIVLKLHYSKGKISLVDKEIKLGYDPDRMIQPEQGYKLDIISKEDNILHSFFFELPNKLYTDKATGEKLSGGYILLDNFDFSLVVPYYTDMSKIRIYDNFERPKISIDKEDVQLSQPRGYLIYYLLIIGIVIAAIYFLRKHKH